MHKSAGSGHQNVWTKRGCGHERGCGDKEREGVVTREGVVNTNKGQECTEVEKQKNT